MPWPEQLGPLLARGDSRAAQALRWGLYGLRASVQAALEHGPDDPAGEQLRMLLAELDPVLEADASPAGAVLPTDSSSDGTLTASSPRLLSLAQAVAADRRLQAELQRSPIRTDSDEEIWNDVHRLLLRAPASVADECRPRTRQFAQQAGARPDEAATVILPLGRDEVLYPGLTGAVQTMGLRTSTTTAPDTRIQMPPDDDLRVLGRIVSTCLWYVEHDPALHHTLQSVFRFGIVPLAGEQRDRYVAEFLRLWERVRAVGGAPAASPRQRFKDLLKAVLDLDEAICSLVYQPLAAPDSWWGRLQALARETLFRIRDRAVTAGCAVHLQLLGGSFADVNRLAPDSLQVDFGVPGEVSACLRVWARLEGEELRGRTLYRSPEEGS
jgi:hypothetical protein